MAKRIFVVDDEKSIADTLAVILRSAGYQVSAFYNAQSALEMAESCFPNLIISDVMMPGMNGVEMAALIRKRHPACKFLLFSGQASTMNLLEMAGEGGRDLEVLAKPVHPTDLLAMVTRLSDSDKQPKHHNSPEREHLEASVQRTKCETKVTKYLRGDRHAIQNAPPTLMAFKGWKQ